ncbi:hypothetical protein OROGR_020309 [Orobanche gracilis]
MMAVEMGGAGGERGVGTAAGGGNIDPSNLHLKKELTQIRKAARILRDPGTSSSWRSPLNSARSLTKHHYVHHHKSVEIDGNGVISSCEQFLQSSSNANHPGSFSDKGNVNVKEREKRVFLYNWRSQKTESERSKQICEEEDDDDDDVGHNSKDEGSFSTGSDGDSLSDARNHGIGNDSKSDAYSDIFRCKDTDFTPSIMRTIRKKSKGCSYNSSAISRHHKEKKLQKQIIRSRYPKNVVWREDFVGLVDRSDDTDDYLNSEDLRGSSTISPLLARRKNKGRTHSSTKILTNHHRKNESISYSTPALSTSSHHKYHIRNRSTIGSWDATTVSFNDADDEVDDQLDLPGRQGCGIPCYWSKRSTPKSRVGYESCCSPSFSDALRRKGSSIFCGTQSIHQRRRSNKRRPNTRIPLLTSNGQQESSICSGNSEDEPSMNFGEHDLEALSRLDERRWSSSCRSQEGLEILALNGDEGSLENVRSLSHKYRPMFFEELIGQNLVVQSLKSSMSRKRVAPVYLFQGPRGTGKTSTARIFAAALNCLAAEENNNNKPCGVCRECVDFISGKSNHIREADGSKLEKIKNFLKSLSDVHVATFSEFKVFVIDECQLLPSKLWLGLLRLVEKPLPNVVFVLITTDTDNVPRTILSRCQRHLFNKIGNGDIVARLRKIGDDENLDVEPDALEMIALNADGSLRDAETMLDQLSLFGKRISVSLVNELIGVVPDEKLLELLELAMSSSATETVIRARELMESGVDPIVLMSQMATLIVDIIAGTYPSADRKRDFFFGGRNLSERELDRLKHALTLLSEAEKHLRVSSERSTWFTATLLQLGSLPSSDRTPSGSSRRQSSKATEDDRTSIKSAHRNSTSKDNHVPDNDNNNNADLSTNPPSQIHFQGDELSVVSQDKGMSGRSGLRCFSSTTLSNVWVQCIEKCHSKTLRQLLCSHGRLVSISEVKGGFVAHVGFVDRNIKTRAEGFLSSITNSFEIVLRHNVEVKMILSPDSVHKQKDKNVEANQVGPFEPASENPYTGSTKSGMPVRRLESIVHEQRLETAWLQATDKGTSRSTGHLKPERNQVLPQDGAGEYSQLDSVEHLEDELNCEIKALKVSDEMMGTREGQIVGRRVDHLPISPSLLHNSSFVSNFSRDHNMGYESGSGAAGCGRMFCWNNSSPERSRKAKQGGTSLHGNKSGRFSWFGECAKSRRGNSRYNR